MVRKHMPVLVMVAIVVAALMPGMAAAQATQSEIRLGRQATLVGGDAFFSDQIIVEYTYRCSGFGSVSAQASQTTTAGTATGTGFFNGVNCDGQLHRDGITVTTSFFPG